MVTSVGMIDRSRPVKERVAVAFAVGTCREGKCLRARGRWDE